MIEKYELDLEALTVESTEISLAPGDPLGEEPVGYQASVIYYTNTRPVQRCATNDASCIA